MITFIVGMVIGAVAMDYMWARRTGTDKTVYAMIKRKLFK